MKVICKSVVVLACFCGISLIPRQGFAAQIDILTEKLAEKGVITYGEAQRIMTETREEFRARQAREEKEPIPGWVKKMGLKGDFRLRHQWQKKETGTTKKAVDRDRTRIRFRLGMDAEVNDRVKLAAGLITGGEDPRSGNQTMEKSFYTGDLRLDYAYAQYKPFDWLTMAGGKVINPLWTNSSMLWSGDIRPDGLSLKMSSKGYPGFETFLNSGVFILDEASGYTADPKMWAIQPGFKWSITDQADLRATFNYYGFSGVKGKKLGYKKDSPVTNSATAGGGYLYDYNSFGTSAELGLKEPLGDGGLPYAGVFGEFLRNPDPKQDRDAWLVGGKIGHAKVGKPGQWQGMYNYRKLEKDAWLDIFPEANFYGGVTGVKGHEVKVQYGLLQNVNLGFAYYNTQNLAGKKRKEDVFQTNLVFKF